MAHITAHDSLGTRNAVAPAADLLGAVVNRLKRYRDARRRRAAFKMLAGLEAWQLEDIGLRVDDVDWAMVLPIETDALAAAKVRARRRAREPGAGPSTRMIGPAATPVTHVHIAAPWLTQIEARGRLDRPWVMGT